MADRRVRTEAEIAEVERILAPKVPGEPLTSAEARVLEALRHLDDDGWPVHVREVQREVYAPSPSTVHKTLHALKAKGLAEQHPRGGDGWRAVRVYRTLP